MMHAANHPSQRSTHAPLKYQTRCSRNQSRRYWTSERCQQTATRPKAWDCQNQKGNSHSDRCPNLTRNEGSPTGKWAETTRVAARSPNTGRKRNSSVSRTSEEPRNESAVWTDKYLKFDGHLDPTTPFSQTAEETMRTSQAARLNVKSVAGSNDQQQTDRRVPQPSAHGAWTVPAHSSEGLRTKKEHALDWRRSRPTQRRRSAIARSLPPSTCGQLP